MIYDVSSPLFGSFLNRSASPTSVGTLALSLPSCALLGDIIIDIVSRLPVISVIRFQLVNKSWRALFRDPTFIGMHFNQTWMTSTEHFIHQKEQWESTRRSLHSAAVLNGQWKKTLFGKLSGKYKIEDCCSGLICLRNLKPKKGAADLFFWNPVIRKVKLLPNYVRCPRDRLGFGFVPSLNDYKVVKMVYTNILVEDSDMDNSVRLAPDVEVFSFRSNSWRRVQNVIPCLPFNEVWAYVNEAVHWRVVATMVGTAIMAFDMVNETFQIIKLPSCLGQMCFNYTPRCLRGSLSVVVDEADSWYVWVMKEYGVATSWSRECKVPCMPRVSASPCDFTRKGEFVFLSLERFKSTLGLVSLNSQRDSYVDLAGDFSRWHPFICAENLILLDGGDDIAELSDLLGGTSSEAEEW